jgi:hypothetical protein
MVSKLVGVRGHDAAILCATSALEDANSHCDLIKISRDDPLEHALTPVIKPHVRCFREALEMKGDF